ncbi:MAG: hypothetical protein ABI697_11480 [Devosia sp.]
MRLLLLSALLSFAAGPAFALCPIIPPDDVAAEINARTEAVVCRQDELATVSDVRFSQLKLAADLTAQQALLEQQLRLQQTLLAQQQAALIPTLP